MLSIKNITILVFLVFADISLASQSLASVDTYLKFENITCESNEINKCYQKNFCNIYEKLKTENKVCKDILMEEDKYFTGLYKGFSIYRLKPKKANTVFVSIHGLWGNARQFSSLFNEELKFSGKDYATIELTLPGHIKAYKDKEFNESYIQEIKENPPFANYQEWIIAVEETLKVANKIANNVVVIGQSTGALLAVYSASKFSHLVDQIILVEPALKVNGLKNWGACTGVKFIPRPILKGIGVLIGTPLPDGVSVEMGCEVQKLASSLFENSKSDKVDDSSFDLVGQSIKASVLMINNEHDEIVSAQVNRYFFETIRAPKHYISFNEDNLMGHGEITEKKMHFIAVSIIDFLFNNTEHSGLEKLYYRRLGNRLSNFLVRNCDRFTGFKVCEKDHAEKVEQQADLINDVCEVTKTANECQKMSNALRRMTAFWDTQIRRVQSKDVLEFKKNIEILKEDSGPDFQKILEHNSTVESFIKSL